MTAGVPRDRRSCRKGCFRAGSAAVLLGALVTVAVAERAWAEAGPVRLRIGLEGAAVWQHRNDFAVPNRTGTRVDLAGANASPTFTGRLEVAVSLGGPWWGRALVAPLRTVTTFVPAADVSFQDATFPAASPVDVHYQFDSYRASVYRRFAWGGAGEWRLGLTAKVRDARIALRGNAIVREETDLGFVPLIYAGATLQALPGLTVAVDVDALGAPQGYAIDASLRAQRSLGRGLRVFAGYRILDGGADVDRVYSFGTFHYATAGLTMTR